MDIRRNLIGGRMSEIILLSCILGMLVLICVLICLHMIVKAPSRELPSIKKIDDFKVFEEVNVREMEEKIREMEQKKRDDDLVRYYNKKNNKGIPPQFRNSRDREDSPVNVRNSKELIPYGWNSHNKKLWEEFNNS